MPELTVRQIHIIAEGDGEVESAPALLPRIAAHAGVALRFGRPLNALGRTNILKGGGIERFLWLAQAAPGCSGVLVLLDSEGPCGVGLARDLAARAHVLALAVPVAITVAVHMYEAWFLGSLESIAGKVIKGRPGLPAGTTLEGVHPEAVADPKAWIKSCLPRGRGYHETADQPAMTAHIDITEAQRSCRSFARLTHAVFQLAEMAGTTERGWTSPM